MNKLLTISVLLLSLNLYGADKKTPNNIGVKDALIRDLNAQIDQLQKERNEFKQKFDVLTKKIEIEKSLASKRACPKHSTTGLEGIAESGLSILVVNHADTDKTFDKKDIENQVKLRLMHSVIGVGKHKHLLDDRLYINAQPVTVGGRVVGYALKIEAYRWMIFKANGKSYGKHAAVWEKGGVAPVDGLSQTINRYMSAFLDACLKANPKKENK